MLKNWGTINCGCVQVDRACGRKGGLAPEAELSVLAARAMASGVETREIAGSETLFRANGVPS